MSKLPISGLNTPYKKKWLRHCPKCYGQMAYNSKSEICFKCNLAEKSWYYSDDLKRHKKHVAELIRLEREIAQMGELVECLKAEAKVERNVRVSKSKV